MKSWRKKKTTFRIGNVNRRHISWQQKIKQLKSERYLDDVLEVLGGASSKQAPKSQLSLDTVYCANSSQWLQSTPLFCTNNRCHLFITAMVWIFVSPQSRLGVLPRQSETVEPESKRGWKHRSVNTASEADFSLRDRRFWKLQLRGWELEQFWVTDSQSKNNNRIQILRSSMCLT